MKIVVLGGGIFGIVIAEYLSKSKHNDVILIEKSSDLLTKASKVNQNRIHFGYHYPRSYNTAVQALNSLNSFYTRFSKSLVSDFKNYYLVSKKNSNLNFNEFITFCQSVKIDSNISMPSDFFINKSKIENGILVKEPIFDYKILRTMLMDDLLKSTVRVLTKKHPKKITKNNNIFSILLNDNSDIECDFIINATYSGLNDILKLVDSKLNLKFQDVVLPIFEYENEKFGLTVMDGPFCSILPLGNDKNKFILSNVKYSILSEKKSNDLPTLNLTDSEIQKMIDDIYFNSAEFFPFLTNVKKASFWRTTKCLPINNDDSRISSIFEHPELSNFISILQGKITTCINIAQTINQKFLKK